MDEVDFETIKERFDAYWEHEIIDRPVIRITARRAKRRKANLPAPQIMEERWTNIDYRLNQIEMGLENALFLGDAIPFAGCGVSVNSPTAFLGGTLTFMETTTWCKPFLEDLSGYHPVLKEDNKWWRLENDMLDALCEAAEGRFLVGMSDPSLAATILALAIGYQRLTRYLFTEPEEVKRVIRELTEICRQVIDRYYERISRVQKGTMVLRAYSRGKSIRLQDDWSGNVSPKMFDEFFAEQIETLSKHLDNTLFHLDGPMALGNLDRLLKIDSLDGIQWMPGAPWVPAGAKPLSEWLDVCRKVLDAGKCLHIYCSPDEVEFLLSRLRHEGLFIETACKTEKEARNVLKIAERFHE